MNDLTEMPWRELIERFSETMRIPIATHENNLRSEIMHRLALVDQLKAELAECRRKTILECVDICERLTHADKPSDQLIGADYCKDAIEALATTTEPSTKTKE